MVARLRIVPYGQESARALRDAVADAKGGDPLAPVTVAVPSNYAGLSLRRRLGSTELPLNGRPGLVNVRFYVLARVAELAGAASLAASGRRPLTSPLRAEAIRTAVEDDPGVFRDVAQHSATERSLQSTFRDLRHASDEALDALATKSRRAADVVRLYRRFRELTAAYYDEEDLARAAALAVRTGSAALRDIGRVVLYLPRRLSPGEQELVEALAAAGGLTAIIGLSGDDEADALARALAVRLEGILGAPDAAGTGPVPAGTHIVAVTDAEEEVRTVLRLVAQRLEASTPLYRIALLYPVAQPYALIAHEQFHAAGVPHNGPSVRTLAQTVTGRALLGLLRLREQNFRREAVADWLSASPVLEGDRPAPAHRWDVLSREAGVVVGEAQWRDRIGRRQRTLEAQLRFLREHDEEGEGRIHWLETDIDHLQRLSAFMHELGERLDARRNTSWSDFAAWAKGLLERYLGGERHQSAWPEGEVQAHRAVEDALGALAALDQLGRRIDESTFRRALERELEAPAERVGRFGDGVFVGRITDAFGLDFDAVFLAGMSEGLLPSRGRDDPLLPDRERLAAGGDLPLRTRRQQEERRDYLAALASAKERVLVFPRADMRGQRGRLPARWLLESASTLEGQRIFSADLESLGAREWLATVASFEAALAGDPAPASAQEYDLRSLLRWQRTGSPITSHYLARTEPALGAGLSADFDRQSSRLTRWDGRVAPSPGLSPAAERPVSPTALQNWAACPFRYFLGRVLAVAETDKPEDALRISAIERGNLMHRALERFIREAAARTHPAQPWSEDERALFQKIAGELCDDAEAAGITGRALLWQLDRAHILRDLHGFLDTDEELRMKHGVVPAAVEHSFGLPDSADPAVAFALDGASIAFRGRIDRIDRAPDGSSLLVIDYKSGKIWDDHKHLQEDSVYRGKLLQLPVYALAAQAKFGDQPVDAYYWFVTEQQDYEPKGYLVTEETRARFVDVLSTIIGGIGDGLFPARPGATSRDGGYENCNFCPFDRICPRDRARAWDRKRGAVELRPYLDLAEPIA